MGMIYIPEVLRVICEHLDGGSTLPTALTCHAFLEPALSERWRCITSFEPLIACLPTDLWKIKQGQAFMTLSLRRSVTPDDLHRYRTFYARRIRSFKLIHTKMNRILSPQALQGLQIATGWEFSALSPLVTHFTWHTPEIYKEKMEAMKHVLPYLSMFLGPNIDSLRFDVCPSDPIQSPFLQSALLRLNGLKTLQLYPTFTGGETDTTTALLSFDNHIKSLPLDHLEVLTVTHITEVTVAYLARLPRLATLIIQSLTSLPGHPPTSGGECVGSPPSYGFPSLRNVTIKALTIQDIVTFFQYLSPEHQLESVDLEVRTSTLASDFQNVIGSIQHRCEPTTLKTLSITICNYGPGSVKLKIRPEPDISPLFSFSNLNELMLNVEGGFSLTPDITARIPSAWPFIQTLHFSSPEINSKMPRIDHTHFLALLQSCSSLGDVELQFDATHISEQDTEPSTGVQAENCCSLDVGNSPIRSPALVAAFFKAHFPSLMSVENGARGDEKEMWTTVDMELLDEE